MESWSDLAKQLWWEMTPQTNYHGTPYTFSKFDDSKFLTGEGFNAHGPGHYSADLLDTAKGYQTNDRVLKYNGNVFDTKEFPHLISDVDYYKSLKKYNNINRLNSVRDELLDNLNTYNNWLNNYDDIPPRQRTFSMEKDHIVDMINSVKTRIHALDNLDKYTIERGGNLYKVNIPNENFMWKEGLPLESQNDYIKNAYRNRGEIDFIKYFPEPKSNPMYLSDELWKSLYDYKYMNTDNIRKKLGKTTHLLQDIYNRNLDNNITKNVLNDRHINLVNKMFNHLDADDTIKFLKNRLNAVDYSLLNSKDKKEFEKKVRNDIQKALGRDVGTKGIRAVGRQDGPINVTFSGKDIRMANTPWQRFTNRIPTQTLGKIARKLYNYPVVKGGVKFLDMFGPSLVVPDMIKLTHPQLYPYTNKEKQRMKNILEKKYGIKINGNRITL